MKNSLKSFIIEFKGFLSERLKPGTMVAGIKVLSFDTKEDCINLLINSKEYSLFLYKKHYSNKEAAYINLRDYSRRSSQESFIQLTVNPTNFIITNDKFQLIQTRGITIGRRQPGITNEFFDTMVELGFNVERIILSGDFKNNDFNKTTKQFFKWLKIITETKHELEIKYRLNLEMDNIDGAFEGDKQIELHLQQERTIRNIQIARNFKKATLKKLGKLECECCSFDFNNTYGVHGKGFIECHHKIHLSKGARITITKDLALVCSNCHRMLHRKNYRGDYYSIKDLKKLISK